ncbi:hypothetical protein TSH100_24450 [Azospirillum sp. TSH100]|uniref:SphA family protein n=1 Tax=Azospirillum sp. TSH100 TaxID=652764 RepID=UPI000D613244|nr:transporter [Azospirillum sp. TSH100]PWC82201.1 hypothetical protein TSH100_24450 [Azospirillum sp. TSH100]QCG90098.1 hypothetical protein E6C72_20290 [Azospirillum sp. TSH100]
MTYFPGSQIARQITAVAVAALSGVLALSAASAWATEGGTSSYLGGSSQFYGAGFPPIPGTYMLSQSNYYSANRLNDGNGNRIPIDFSIRTYSETIRILHITDLKLAGADVVTQLVVPLVHGNLSVMGHGDTQTSVADMTGTLALTWHFGPHSVVTGLDFTGPTGRYKKENALNIGTNHWSLQPTLGYKYFDPEGFELSVVPRLVFNTKNTATDYTSGNELYVDYAVGWNFGPTKVGLVGYAYQQFTDDKGQGVGSDGNRGKAFAIGPSLTYSFTPALHVSGSWQRELVAEHRTQGNALWVNFGLKL